MKFICFKRYDFIKGEDLGKWFINNILHFLDTDELDVNNIIEFSVLQQPISILQQPMPSMPPNTTTLRYIFIKMKSPEFAMSCGYYLKEFHEYQIFFYDTMEEHINILSSIFIVEKRKRLLKEFLNINTNE